MEQTREQILLSNKEEGRESAVAEALALKYRYEGSYYSFEYGGKCVSARFVTACLQTAMKPVSGYRIELLAPHQTLVDGPCVVTDLNGHKLNAVASTTHGENENLITIETTAWQPVAQSV